MICRHGRVALTAACMVATGLLFGQSTTTGGILGSARGPDGRPLAGVRVIALSGQISRIVATGEDGTFQMGLMNPGPWTIRLAKPGYTAPPRTIVVLTDADLTLNFRMVPEAGAAVVVVASPDSIDVTATSQGLQLELENLRAVPMSREITDLAAFTAGVNADPVFSNPVISGASGAENSYVLDGLVTTDFRVGFQGTGMKTDFIDQFEVQTGGFRPEYSALGGVVVAVTKSGSNVPAGSAWMTWDAVGLKPAPKQTLFTTEAPPDSRYDLGCEVRGPLVKDRLFYFVGLDGQGNRGQVPLPNQDPGLAGSRPSVNDLQAVGKLNAFLNPDAQVTLFTNFERVRKEQGVATYNTGTANLGQTSTKTITNLNLALDWTLGPSVLLSAKLGSADNRTVIVPSDSSRSIDDSWYYLGGPGAASRPDLAYFDFLSGGIGHYVPYTGELVDQARLDLSWLLGGHTLKFGLSQIQARFTKTIATAGPADPSSSDGVSALVYGVGSDQSLGTYEYHGQGTARTAYGAFYAQDTWEARPGLRLMYGARQERQRLFGTDGQTILAYGGWRYLQPRLGFSWDVANDARTKVTASYAVYYESIPQTLNWSAFGHFTWIDKTYPASAYNYNNGQPVLTDPAGYTSLWSGVGDTHDPIAEGTRLPRRMELTAGVEHTMGHWTLGVHGKYRKLTDVLEDSCITDAAGNPYDSGPAMSFDGAGHPTSWGGQFILWNPGPSAAWTAVTDPSSQNPGQHFAIANTLFPRAFNLYRSFDLTIQYKAGRDYLQASCTWSRLTGNYEGLVQTSNRQAMPNISAAFDFWPYVGTGLLPLDRTWVIKGLGSHRFTVLSRDLDLGCALTLQSGTPLSQLDSSYTFGGYYGATYVGGLQGDRGRTPFLESLDLHLDWVWGLPGGVRLAPQVDVFNSLNGRKPIQFDQTSDYGMYGPNPSYGQPLAWQAARSWRFGAKLQF